MKKIKAADFFTHIDNEEDFRYLQSVLFDVNMRLFNNSFEYRKIVQKCCDYLGFLALSEYDDYKKPHGTSGANAGIPWNIIAIVRNRGSAIEYSSFLINPTIVKYAGKEIETESNCGSIRLPKPIKVKRWEEVLVEFFDYNGKFHREMFFRKNGSLTIQHEIDHNNGILITERQEKTAAIV